MISNSILLPCEYFPCIAWFQHLLTANSVVTTEQHEFFVRASMRNRCYIAGSNGIIALTIPLAGGRNQKTIMQDVKVSHDTNWQALHWKTIESCYRRSPYFEYYSEEVNKYFDQKFDYLVEWNLASVQLIQRLLKLQVSILKSTQYMLPSALHAAHDFRSSWNAHNYQRAATDIVYWQTFENKIGFQSNLSILDLLFCEGKPLLNRL